MTPEAFNQQFNPDTQCLAQYVDEEGQSRQGALIGEPDAGRSGELFVYIDSYDNLVPLSRLVSVKDTDIAL